MCDLLLSSCSLVSEFVHNPIYDSIFKKYVYLFLHDLVLHPWNSFSSKAALNMNFSELSYALLIFI